MPAGHAASLRAFVDRHTALGDAAPAFPQLGQPVGVVVGTRPHRTFADLYAAPKDGPDGPVRSLSRETVTVYDRAQAVELFRAYLRRRPESVDPPAANWLPGPDVRVKAARGMQYNADELLRIAAGGKP